MIKLTTFPIKQPDQKKPRQLKVLIRTWLLLTAAVTSLYGLGFFGVSKVSAAAILPPCTNTFMETWDWPADLRRGARSGFTDGGGISNFDYEKDSYIIYLRQIEYTATPKRNVFIMLRVQAGNGQINLKDVSGVPKAGMGAGVIHFKMGAMIISEPRKLVLSGYYVWPSGYNDVETIPSNDSTTDTTLDATNVYCMAVAHNVVYDNSWTWNKFVSNLDFKAGADASTSCTTLDIACKLKQAWEGVTDAFVSVGQAIVQGIASLFMPDGTQIKADFDDLTSFLNAKLGFLTYPVTFFVNMFNAFSSTANNWCTASSCSKNFGNLFGHAFNVDLKVGATAYPTYWTYFLGLTRGLVVLGLLLAVRKKYLGVIHK